LVQDDAVLENIQSLWKKYIKQPLSQVNIDQALIPSKAIALMNHLGSAPGMWFEKKDKVFISLPGVPYEMKALITNEVLSKLQNKYHFPYIKHKTIITYGLGESKLAERIEDWEDALPSFIKLAYLPNLGKVRLRLSAKGHDKQEIEHKMESQIKKLLPIIEDVFVSFEEEDSIQTIIGKKLVESYKTLSVAESCTGGKIAELITEKSGASAFFKGSIVSYATQAKEEVLGIDKKMIEKYSVVSNQVAEAMAKNVKRLFKTDYAISTTGNAGPLKGDSDAEVGTVYIAIATPNIVFSEKFSFGNGRTKVINKASNKAFEMLLKEILKN